MHSVDKPLFYPPGLAGLGTASSLEATEESYHIADPEVEPIMHHRVQEEWRRQAHQPRPAVEVYRLAPGLEQWARTMLALLLAALIAIQGAKYVSRPVPVDTQAVVDLMGEAAR